MNNSDLKKKIQLVAKEISREWRLKESWTAYNKYGKGKKARLRFSKSGNEKIEKTYATHYVKIEKKRTNT